MPHSEIVDRIKMMWSFKNKELIQDNESKLDHKVKLQVVFGYKKMSNYAELCAMR